MFTKPERPVSRVFLHCSASDNPDHDNINVIRQWHLARGFTSIGYQYFIQKDGVRKSGRSLELIPAAQKGHNTGTIAVCLHGLGVHNFTDAQRKSLKELCTEINMEYKGKISFHGHKEVSNKLCPVFPYKQWLNLDSYGRIKSWETQKKSVPLVSLISRLLTFIRGLMR